MPDVYDDPDLRDDDFPPIVQFRRVGDRVRGRVLSVDVVNTRFQSKVLRYQLMTERGQETLMAGGVNMRGQMLSLKPRVGDVLDVELIEIRNSANGNTKIYDVQVDESARESLAPPPRQAENSRPAREPVTRPDDEGDLFDEQ